MTIALGILTPQSIIVAADSEEVADFRTASSKITVCSSLRTDAHNQPQETCLAITGAGDAGYLDFVKRQVIDLIINAHPEDQLISLNDFHAKLQRLIRHFYRLHIIPFKHLELSVEVIVGVRIRGESAVFVTCLNTVRRAASTIDVAAVGLGRTWALNVLANSSLLVNETSATIMTIQAVRSAKYHATGCGKDTTIVSIPRNVGALRIANTRAVREIESILEEYQATAIEQLLFVCGGPVNISDDIGARLKRCRQQIQNAASRLYSSDSLPEWATPSDSKT